MKKTINFEDFILGINPRRKKFTYVSLFSGAGISDFGLKLAGGICKAACELDRQRQFVHSFNLKSKIWGDICTEKEQLLEAVKDQKIDLVIATPPCQSFSTANALRGKHNDPEYASRDHRNTLFFEALSVINNIKPKIAVFENVPNFLLRQVYSKDKKITGKVKDFLEIALSDYVGWSDAFCFSNLGIPQRRKRALAIFVRKDIYTITNKNSEHPLSINNWPIKVKNVPTTVVEALRVFEYHYRSSLISSDHNKLYLFPKHSEKHFRWISDIPPYSGKSAWENICINCKSEDTPIFEVICRKCGGQMKNRPHVSYSNGKIRPIKGFKTSYKRMVANDLAPTVTTASDAFSSDTKIHPYENRVLTSRECAFLQGIPYTFKWPEEVMYKKASLIREMIGEAVPPIISFQLGMAIVNYLSCFGE